MRTRAASFVPALYTVLVVAPAVLALLVDPFDTRRAALVEVSAALGLFAVPIILLQFVLVSRIRWVSRRVGTDALVQLHQYAGLLAVILVALHVLLLNLRWLPWRAWSPFHGPLASQTGAIALWAIVLIAITSIARASFRLSYESWRSIHVVLAFAAAIALTYHVLAVNGYTRAVSMRVLVGALLALFAGATIEYRILRPLALRRRPWTVVMNRDEGASIRTLRVRPVGHDGFAFAPGQFAWLITGTSPFSSQQHPLSVSSSAVRDADGSIEFSIKALGDWSSQTVPALTAGTTVWVDGPFGSFVPTDTSLRPLVLIAGGIGIAPMRSILLTLGDRRDERHVVLIYAAHDESRVAFRAELDALKRSLHLKLVFVYEVPSSDWRGPRGYVTTELLRETLGTEARHAECLVCGPVAMMDAVERSLVGAGVPAGAIHSERFQVV